MQTRLVIPEQTWHLLGEIFRRDKRHIEQVVFLEGLIVGNTRVVTTVTVPNARLSATHYTVPTDAIIECAAVMRTERLQRVAQVHTHPGWNVDHSPYDDTNAYSYEDEAVSIVIPHYGKRELDLRKCGLHICEGGQWRRDFGERLNVQITPAFKDFRKWQKKYRPDTKGGLMESINQILKKMLER